MGVRHGAHEFPGICNDRARFATKTAIGRSRNEKRRGELRRGRCCEHSTYGKRLKVSPAGFEPATFGFGGRRSVSVKAIQDNRLRQVREGEVLV